MGKKNGKRLKPVPLKGFNKCIVCGVLITENRTKCDNCAKIVHNVLKKSKFHYDKNEE